MNPLRIYQKNSNLEIVSKIMDSVAQKCNCRVHYSHSDHSIRFYGNADYVPYIVEETLAFFRQPMEMEDVCAKHGPALVGCKSL